MTIQKSSHTLAKIHTKALRTNRFYILLTLSFTVFINTFSFAQVDNDKNESIKISPKAKPKATPVSSVKANDSLVINSSELVLKETDTTKLDSVKPKEALLQATVTYGAKDYNAFNKKEQKMYLYNEAYIQYQDMDITAGH